MLGVVLLIFGLLFLLFGGGCVFLVVTAVAQNPEGLGTASEAVNIIIVAGVLGVLPLALGILMLRNGVKRLRGPRKE